MEVFSLISFGAVMYLVLIGIPSMIEIAMESNFSKSLRDWFGKTELHTFGR